MSAMGRVLPWGRTTGLPRPARSWSTSVNSSATAVACRLLNAYLQSLIPNPSFFPNGPRSRRAPWSSGSVSGAGTRAHYHAGHKVPAGFGTSV